MDHMRSTSQISALTKQKTVKLRESCDSCLGAKVKCGKEKPLCKRCLVHGSPCAYSPSLKTGRKSQHTAGRDTPQDRVKVAASADPTLSLPGKDSEASKIASEPSNTIDFLNAAQDFLDQKSETEHNHKHRHTSSNRMTFDFSGEDGAIASPQTQQLESSLSSSSFLDPFFPFLGIGDAYGSPAPVDQQTATGTNERSSIDPKPSTSPYPYLRSLSQVPASFVRTPPSSNSSPHESSELPCECFPTCVQVLQILHNHSSLLSTTRRDGEPSFDIILKSNAEALETCDRVLNCTQCVSEYGVMMLATIIGKVISIYRAACNFLFNVSDTRDSKAQLAFGIYNLTGESKHLLEMELLFLDLRRVSCTLIGFAQRFCNQSTDQGNETAISDVLRSHLENDLSDLVRVIQGAKEQREERLVS